MINVYIADDHALIREGLKRIIAGEKDMIVFVDAMETAAGLESILKIACDVLILNLAMPGTGDLNLIRQIKNQHQKLPILVLSMCNVETIVTAALDAGADGYLTLDTDPNRLIKVIRALANGGKYIDPAMAQTLAFCANRDKQPHEQLSKREHQVFFMIVKGKSTSRIANELFLSPKTISSHKKRILEKMKADNIAELVRYALHHQLIGYQLQKH